MLLQLSLTFITILPKNKIIIQMFVMYAIRLSLLVYLHKASYWLQ